MPWSGLGWAVVWYIRVAALIVAVYLVISRVHGRRNREAIDVSGTESG
jgi:hypothetical protein